ncbi:hypothetical protein MASR1M74_16650 [Lentimicrobium sp.]
MNPMAQKDHIPIYGIDRWNKEAGDKWRKLPRNAYHDTTLMQEINFIGGLFSLFDGYFKNQDY